jgi:hypothetical protein
LTALRHAARFVRKRHKKVDDLYFGAGSLLGLAPFFWRCTQRFEGMFRRCGHEIRRYCRPHFHEGAKPDVLTLIFTMSSFDQ